MCPEICLVFAGWCVRKLRDRRLGEAFKAKVDFGGCRECINYQIEQVTLGDPQDRNIRFFPLRIQIGGRRGISCDSGRLCWAPR